MFVSLVDERNKTDTADEKNPPDCPFEDIWERNKRVSGGDAKGSGREKIVENLSVGLAFKVVNRDLGQEPAVGDDCAIANYGAENAG